MIDEWIDRLQNINCLINTHIRIRRTLEILYYNMVLCCVVHIYTINKWLILCLD